MAKIEFTLTLSLRYYYVLCCGSIVILPPPLLLLLANVPGLEPVSLNALVCVSVILFEKRLQTILSPRDTQSQSEG